MNRNDSDLKFSDRNLQVSRIYFQEEKNHPSYLLNLQKLPLLEFHRTKKMNVKLKKKLLKNDRNWEKATQYFIGPPDVKKRDQFHRAVDEGKEERRW